ncbi:MAG: hypothetical protein ACJAV3_000487 [Alcanivorax sp.]|jgi:hypothetical protein
MAVRQVKALVASLREVRPLEGNSYNGFKVGA